MTNNSHFPHGTTLTDAALDPFEVALAALRSAGVGFEVVGEFDGIGIEPDSFERAA